MKIQIKTWRPKNNNSFQRFYVTTIEGEKLGYIQTYIKQSQYGNEYYGSHRAAKGDIGFDETTNYKVVGKYEALEKVVDAVKQKGLDLRICLLRNSINALVAGTKEQQEAQKEIVVEI